MLQLICLTRSHCLLKTSCSYLVAAHRSIQRGICFSHPSGRNTSTKISPPTSILYVPKRCLQKEPPIKKRHKQDNVPETYELIHHNGLYKRLLLTIYGVGFTGALLLTSVSLFLARIVEIELNDPFEIPFIHYDISNGVAIPLFYFGIILAVPLWYNSKLAFRRLIRIYYNPESKQFIGIVKNNFRKKKIDFTLKDVQPVIESMTEHENLSIKGKKYLVFQADFASMEYVNLVMRYNR